MEKFNDYLESLPLTKAVKGRISEVLSMNNEIFNFQIEDIFICELKNEEGARSYTSLWMFTKEVCIECKDFLTRNDFDIAPLKDEIHYCSIEIQDFDLKNSNEKSFVKVHFTFKSKVSGNIISTDENCVWALKIYKKHIIPNMNLISTNV